MKRTWLLILIPVVAHAQFVAVEQSDKDKSFTRTEIHVDTMDRNVVPLVTESKEKKLSDTKTQTDAVTQTRLSDGSYFGSQRTTSMEEKVSPTETRTTTQVNDTDRQGQTRTTRQVSETVVKTAAGERREQVELKRNSSGQLVTDSQVSETVTKAADGSSTAQRVESERDVNGDMTPKRKVQEETTARGPNEKVTISSVRSYSHLDGAFTETAREETVVRTTGSTTQSERIIQERVGTTWALKGKVATKEVVGPTGAIERETIQYGQPLHTGDRTAAGDALQPKTKIVERYTTGANGTAKLQRDVYRRDVNGDWKPQSFSTDFNGSGEKNYGR